jgi:hypothetical protein
MNKLIKFTTFLCSFLVTISAQSMMDTTLITQLNSNEKVTKDNVTAFLNGIDHKLFDLYFIADTVLEAIKNKDKIIKDENPILTILPSDLITPTTFKKEDGTVFFEAYKIPNGFVCILQKDLLESQNTPKTIITLTNICDDQKKIFNIFKLNSIFFSQQKFKFSDICAPEFTEEKATAIYDAVKKENERVKAIMEEKKAEETIPSEPEIIVPEPTVETTKASIEQQEAQAALIKKYEPLVEQAAKMGEIPKEFGNQAESWIKKIQEGTFDPEDTKQVETFFANLEDKVSKVKEARKEQQALEKEKEIVELNNGLNAAEEKKIIELTEITATEKAKNLEQQKLDAENKAIVKQAQIEEEKTKAENEYVEAEAQKIVEQLANTEETEKITLAQQNLDALLTPEAIKSGWDFGAPSAVWQNKVIAAGQELILLLHNKDEVIKTINTAIDEVVADKEKTDKWNVLSHALNGAKKNIAQKLGVGIGREKTTEEPAVVTTMAGGPTQETEEITTTTIKPIEKIETPVEMAPTTEASTTIIQSPVMESIIEPEKIQPVEIIKTEPEIIPSSDFAPLSPRLQSAGKATTDKPVTEQATETIETKPAVVTTMTNKREIVETQPIEKELAEKLAKEQAERESKEEQEKIEREEEAKRQAEQEAQELASQREAAQQKFETVLKDVGTGWNLKPSPQWQDNIAEAAITLIKLNNTAEIRNEILNTINEKIEEYNKPTYGIAVPFLYRQSTEARNFAKTNIFKQIYLSTLNTTKLSEFINYFNTVVTKGVLDFNNTADNKEALERTDLDWMYNYNSKYYCLHPKTFKKLAHDAAALIVDYTIPVDAMNRMMETDLREAKRGESLQLESDEGVTLSDQINTDVQNLEIKKIETLEAQEREAVRQKLLLSEQQRKELEAKEQEEKIKAEQEKTEQSQTKEGELVETIKTEPETVPSSVIEQNIEPAVVTTMAGGPTQETVETQPIEKENTEQAEKELAEKLTKEQAERESKEEQEKAEKEAKELAAKIDLAQQTFEEVLNNIGAQWGVLSPDQKWQDEIANAANDIIALENTLQKRNEILKTINNKIDQQASEKISKEKLQFTNVKNAIGRAKSYISQKISELEKSAEEKSAPQEVTEAQETPEEKEVIATMQMKKQEREEEAKKLAEQEAQELAPQREAAQKNFDGILAQVGIGWNLMPSTTWQKNIGDAAIALIKLNNTAEIRNATLATINNAIDAYEQTLWGRTSSYVKDFAKTNIFKQIYLSTLNTPQFADFIKYFNTVVTKGVLDFNNTAKNGALERTDLDWIYNNNYSSKYYCLHPKTFKKLAHDAAALIVDYTIPVDAMNRMMETDLREAKRGESMQLESDEGVTLSDQIKIDVQELEIKQKELEAQKREELEAAEREAIRQRLALSEQQRKELEAQEQAEKIKAEQEKIEKRRAEEERAAQAEKEFAESKQKKPAARNKLDSLLSQETIKNQWDLAPTAKWQSDVSNAATALIKLDNTPENRNTIINTIKTAINDYNDTLNRVTGQYKTQEVANAIYNITRTIYRGTIKGFELFEDYFATVANSVVEQTNTEDVAQNNPAIHWIFNNEKDQYILRPETLNTIADDATTLIEQEKVPQTFINTMMTNYLRAARKNLFPKFADVKSLGIIDKINANKLTFATQVPKEQLAEKIGTELTELKTEIAKAEQTKAEQEKAEIGTTGQETITTIKTLPPVMDVKEKTTASFNSLLSPAAINAQWNIANAPSINWQNDTVASAIELIKLNNTATTRNEIFNKIDTAIDDVLQTKLIKYDYAKINEAKNNIFTRICAETIPKVNEFAQNFSTIVTNYKDNGQWVYKQQSTLSHDTDKDEWVEHDASYYYLAPEAFASLRTQIIALIDEEKVPTNAIERMMDIILEKAPKNDYLKLESANGTKLIDSIHDYETEKLATQKRLEQEEKDRIALEMQQQEIIAAKAQEKKAQEEKAQRKAAKPKKYVFEPAGKKPKEYELEPLSDEAYDLESLGGITTESATITQPSDVTAERKTTITRPTTTSKTRSIKTKEKPTIPQEYTYTPVSTITTTPSYRAAVPSTSYSPTMSTTSPRRQSYSGTSGTSSRGYTSPYSGGRPARSSSTRAAYSPSYTSPSYSSSSSRDSYSPSRYDSGYSYEGAGYSSYGPSSDTANYSYTYEPAATSKESPETVTTTTEPTRRERTKKSEEPVEYDIEPAVIGTTTNEVVPEKEIVYEPLSAEDIIKETAIEPTQELIPPVPATPEETEKEESKEEETGWLQKAIDTSKEYIRSFFKFFTG